MWYHLPLQENSASSFQTVSYDYLLLCCSESSAIMIQINHNMMFFSPSGSMHPCLLNSVFFGERDNQMQILASASCISIVHARYVCVCVYQLRQLFTEQTSSLCFFSAPLFYMFMSWIIYFEKSSYLLLQLKHFQPAQMQNLPSACTSWREFASRPDSLQAAKFI